LMHIAVLMVGDLKEKRCKEVMAERFEDTLKRQVGGDHYKQLPIQPWEIIDACGLSFYEGNAIKYILRKKDNRIQDLEKAIHYLEHQIELLRSLQ